MMTDDDLDSLFAAARNTAPAPSTALTARVEADAMREMPRAPTLRPVARPTEPRGLGDWIARLFGSGAGALAGMATATVAGLYFGYAQPIGADVFSLVTGAADSATIDMMPGIDALLEEAP